MTITKRYFYADKIESPDTPVFKVMQSMFDRRQAALDKINAIVERIGAKSAVGRSNVEGFVFKDDAAPKGWIVVGHDESRRPFYRPKKIGKANIALLNELRSIRLPWTEDVINDLGLLQMLVDDGRSLVRSVMGFRDDRAYFVIPFAESKKENKPIDKAIELAGLTGWKQWEMQRWVEEGRPTAT